MKNWILANSRMLSLPPLRGAGGTVQVSSFLSFLGGEYPT